ncbi:unnamed protein product, partial [Meganyctiphanes norvegica]
FCSNIIMKFTEIAVFLFTIFSVACAANNYGYHPSYKKVYKPYVPPVVHNPLKAGWHDHGHSLHHASPGAHVAIYRFGYGNTGIGYGNTGFGYGNAGFGYGNAGFGYGNAGFGYGNAGFGYGKAGFGYGNPIYVASNPGATHVAPLYG